MHHRQFTSSDAQYELTRQSDDKSPSNSFVSELRPSERTKTFSSRTVIVDSNAQIGDEPSREFHSRLGHPWQPGFWARFPWLGILALLTTIFATVACVVVLIESQNVAIDDWESSLQPPVYLSICTAVANITLTYALYEGVVISFWRKASDGATLRELHRYWHSGSSVWGALRAAFNLRGKATAFACLMTVISILRGPLMQRASSVKNTIVLNDGNLTVNAALQLPLGYAGRSTGRSSLPSFMNPNFTNIVQAYTNKDDISGIWNGCKSTCYAEVQGFGFGVSCNTSEMPYDLSPVTVNGTTTLVQPLDVFVATASQIESYTGSPDEGGPLTLNYSFALLLNTTRMATGTDSYNGSFVQHKCALRGGVLSYPIKITNDTVNLQSSTWRNDTFLEDWNLGPVTNNQPSNLAGFILAVKALYYGVANLQFGGGVGWTLNLEGASANRYLESSNITANSITPGPQLTWRDPMEDMINSMREIAFRTSLQIAADNTSYPNASQTIPYRGETPTTVYTTNYAYMASAVAVSLLGVLAVIPTYRGFWKLGRPVSLSPLEIAKAFNAPLLETSSGNRTAESMLTEIGATRVRYGDSGVVTRGLAIAPGNESGVRKMGMGLVTDVRRPEKGARYI